MGFSDGSDGKPIMDDRYKRTVSSRPAGGSSQASKVSKKPTKRTPQPTFVGMLRRFEYAAWSIYELGNALERKTKPDQPERYDGYPVEKRRGRFPNVVVSTEIEPGSVALFTMAEEMRELRVGLNLRCPDRFRDELETLSREVLDAAVAYAGNLSAASRYDKHYLDRFKALNQAALNFRSLIKLVERAGKVKRKRPPRKQPVRGSALSEVQREAVDLVLLHGNPHRAALAIGVSPSTMDTRFKTALAKLPHAEAEKIRKSLKVFHTKGKKAFSYQDRDRRGINTLDADEHDWEYDEQ